MYQLIIRSVHRIWGSRPRHALEFGAVLTVAAIVARITAERKAIEAHGRHAATPVPPVPMSDPDTIIAAAAVTVPDPDRPKYPAPPAPPADPNPTLPLTRTELAEVIEVSGGRPIHDLDYVQRQQALAAEAEAEQWRTLFTRTEATGGAR